MKKIFLFLAMAGMAAFTTGCSNDDDVDRDTISEVFERTVTFSGPNFSAVVPLNPTIFDSDVILVYRRTVDVDGFAVWQSIPRTIYFDNGGEIDYDFNFTLGDVQIFMQSNGLADLNNLPAYTQNQRFRIVIVPGYFANTIDTSDYNAVINALEQNGGNTHVQTIER